MHKTLIYIVRHGESEHNVQKITSGHVNPQLTDNGRQQAENARLELSSIKFDQAYSSDLDRAKETAEIIFGSKLKKNHQLPSLRERDFGNFDGKPDHLYEKIKSDNAEELSRLNAKEQWRFRHHPTVETHHELSSRIIKSLAEIADKNMGKTILVVAHGGALRTTLINLGYATEKELPDGSIENAGYAELIYKDGEFEVEKVVGANKRIV